MFPSVFPTSTLAGIRAIAATHRRFGTTGLRSRGIDVSGID